MKLMLLGAPGAGKGTQAEIICEKYQIPAISTGAIIRKAVADQTEMGLAAKDCMDAGKLVPDEVVIGIVRDRLKEKDCEEGFLLDGFPRTVPQAKALDDMGVVLDKVIVIEVADEDIVRRMGGRRVCPDCGATYHLAYKPSSKADKCDKCGATLIQRKDDAPETVLDRLEIYHKETQPLVDFYKAKGILVSVKGCEELEDTTKGVLSALEQ